MQTHSQGGGALAGGAAPSALRPRRPPSLLELRPPEVAALDWWCSLLPLLLLPAPAPCSLPLLLLPPPENPLSLLLLWLEYLALPPLLPPDMTALLPRLPVLRPEERQEEERGESSPLPTLPLPTSAWSHSSRVVVCGRGIDTPRPGTPDTPDQRPEAPSGPTISLARLFRCAWRCPWPGPGCPSIPGGRGCTPDPGQNISNF